MQDSINRFLALKKLKHFDVEMVLIFAGSLNRIMAAYSQCNVSETSFYLLYKKPRDAGNCLGQGVELLIGRVYYFRKGTQIKIKENLPTYDAI